MKLKLFKDASDSRPVSHLRGVRSPNDFWRWLKWRFIQCRAHRSRSCFPLRALWAFEGFRSEQELPDEASGDECRREASECGSCWCGKYVDEAVMRRKYPGSFSPLATAEGQR